MNVHFFKQTQRILKTRLLVRLFLAVFLSLQLVHCDEGATDLNELAQAIGVPGESDRNTSNTDDPANNDDLNGSDSSKVILPAELSTSVSWDDTQVTLNWTMPESFSQEYMQDISFDLCSASSASECTKYVYEAMASFDSSVSSHSMTTSQSTESYFIRVMYKGELLTMKSDMPAIFPFSPCDDALIAFSSDLLCRLHSPDDNTSSNSTSVTYDANGQPLSVEIGGTTYSGKWVGQAEDGSTLVDSDRDGVHDVTVKKDATGKETLLAVAPLFSPSPEKPTQELSVTISAPSVDHICYSTNGSVPVCGSGDSGSLCSEQSGSVLYQGNILLPYGSVSDYDGVDRVFTLKARSCRSRYLPSNVTTAEYRIDRKAPGAAAISVPESGIKKDSIEYTLPASIGDEEIKSYEVCDDAQGQTCQIIQAGNYTKTGLLPYRDYTIYVKAIDVAGNKAASFQNISVRTKSLGVAPKPILTAAHKFSAGANFQEVTISGTPGQAKVFYTREASAVECDSQDNLVKEYTEKLTIPVAGPVSGNDEIVVNRVTAIACQEGYEPSPISEIFVDLNSPKQPEAPSTSSPQYSQLQLNFPPGAADVDTNEYKACLGTSCQQAIANPEPNQAAPSIVFTGLSPLTEYSIDLQTIDSAGNISLVTQFKAKTSSMGPVNQATPSLVSGTVLYKDETVELQAMEGATICARTDGQPASCDEQANCLAGSESISSLAIVDSVDVSIVSCKIGYDPTPLQLSYAKDLDSWAPDISSMAPVLGLAIDSQGNITGLVEQSILSGLVPDNAGFQVEYFEYCLASSLDTCNFVRAANDRVLATESLLNQSDNLYVRAVGGSSGEYISNPVSIELPAAITQADLDEAEKMQQVSFVEFNGERSSSVSYNSESKELSINLASKSQPLEIQTAGGDVAVASFSPTVSGLAENNESSAYDGAQEVSFSSLNSGGTYCYTTDGSIPACVSGSCTAGSTGSSVTLERSATVKAVSCVAGFGTSDVYTASYIIDAEVPTAPSSVSPSAVESTGSLKSVALSWGNASDDVTSALTYEVCWSTSETACATSFTANQTTTSTSLQIDNLDPLETYYFSVRAKDGLDKTGTVASGSVTTQSLGDLPAASISVPSGIYNSNQSVSLNNAIGGAKVCLSKDEIAQCVKGVCQVGAAAQSFSVTETSTWSFVSCAKGYNPAIAQSISYTIDKVPPPQPNLGLISSASSEPTEATILFPSATEDIDSYELCLNGSCTTGNASEGSLNLAGLEPKTAYTGTLTAIDAAGNRSASVQIDFETKSLGQLPPPNFSIEAGTYYQAQQVVVTAEQGKVCTRTDGSLAACNVNGDCAVGSSEVSTFSLQESTVLNAVTCQKGYDEASSGKNYVMELAPVLPGTPVVEVGISIEQNIVTNIARLTWSAASDPGAINSPAELEYQVCRGSTATSCQESYVSSDTVTGQASILLENQDKTATPFLAVRAIDQEGNQGNAIQVQTEADAPVELVRYNGVLYDSSRVRLVSAPDGSLAEVQVDVSGDGSYALKVPATPGGELAVAAFVPAVTGLEPNDATSPYDGSQVISFSSLNDSDSYCYTIDGSIPACDSGTCTAGVAGNGVTLAKSSTVKVVSCVAGYATSDVFTTSYVIDAEPPTAPVSLTPAAVQSSGDRKSIALNWGNATDDVSDSLTYEICWSKSETECQAAFTVNASTTANNLTINDLDPLETYYFTVRAKDSLDKNGAITVSSATTQSLGDIEPVNLSIAPGLYDGAQSLALSSNTSAARFCYSSEEQPVCSNDGCAKGATYNGAIALSESTSINYIACATGYNPASAQTASYVLDLQNPAAVQQVSASAVSATALNVSWTAASDDTTSTSALSYEVCASKSAGACFSNFEALGETTSGVTSLQLPDLEPYQIYYIAVRAKDSFEKLSPLQTNVSETASLGTLSAATITPATAVFNETQQVALSTESGAICATSDSSEPACNRNGSCRAGEAVTSMAITESSQVQAITCKAGYKPSSIAVASFTADTQSPVLAGDIAAVALRTNAIDLEWPNANDDTTQAANLVYDVCYSTSLGGCLGENFEAKLANIQTTTTTIDNLNPYVVYSYAVKAKDAFGKTSSVLSGLARTASSGQAAAPSFDLSSGIYGTAKTVALNGAGKVCYTLDGSAPKCNEDANACEVGATYSSSLYLSSSQTVRALSCRQGYEASEVTSLSFQLDQEAPGQVQALTLAATTNSMVLQWTAATDNLAGVSQYEVCLNGANCTTVESTTHTFSSLSPRTSYSFSVKAIDAVGNKGSAVAQSSQTDSLGRSVTPSVNIAGGVYGQGQALSLVAQGASSICVTSDGSSPQCSASYTCAAGVNALQGYTVSQSQTIKAVSCQPGYDESQKLTEQYVIDTVAPSVVANLSVQAAAQAASLSWSAATDEEAGISAYEVCVNDDCTTTAATVFEANELSALTGHLVKVTAIDGVGNRSDAVEQSFTTLALGIVATPQASVNAGLYGSAQTVTLTATDAAICYTNDGTEPACTMQGACLTGSSYTQAVSISQTSTLQAIGCREGYTSSTISSYVYTIDQQPPTAVTSLAGSGLTTNSAVLTWGAASDAISGIQEYQVCRSSEAGQCEANWSAIGKTGAERFEANNLAPRSKYFFAIRALDSMGNIGPVVEAEVNTASMGPVAQPGYTLAAGSFNQAQNVGLTAQQGAFSCVTNDGSAPACDVSCENGTRYESPLNLASGETTLKAISCMAGYDPSGVAVASYHVDTSAPSAVSGLAIDNIDQQSASLSWQPATDQGTGIETYEYCYSDNLQGCDSFEAMGTIAANSQAISSLSALTSYVFSIRAVDQVGNRGPAAKVEGRTASLGQASAVTIAGQTLANAPVAVSMAAGPNSVICYSDNQAPACSASGNACLSGNTYSGGLTLSASSQIFAIGCQAGYDPSPVASRSFTIDQEAPTKVQALVAANNSGNALLVQWVSASDNLAAAHEIQYQVCQSSTENGCNNFQVSQTVSGNSVVLENLQAKSKYSLAVRAVDTVGNTSDPVQAVGETGSLGTLGSPIITFNQEKPYWNYFDNKVTYRVFDSPQQVNLLPSTGGDAHYTTDGSDPDCSSTKAGGPITISETTLLKTLTCKTGYDSSEIVSAQYIIDNDAPSKPAQFAATASGQQGLTLSWQPAVDTANPSQYLTYQICINEDENGCETFNPAQTTQAGASAATITGLQGRTAYTVALRAVDPAGNLSEPLAVRVQTNSQGVASEPAYSIASGVFSSNQSLTIDKNGATNVCYTTAGQNATPENPVCNQDNACATGALYTEAIAINQATKVKALACKAGYDPSGIVNAAYVVDNQAPAKPSLSASATKDSATLSWSKVSDNLTEQNKVRYEICFKEGTNNCDFAKPEFVLTNAESQVLSNLKPLTNYRAGIRSVDALGNRSAVNYQEFTTAALGTLDTPVFFPTPGEYGKGVSVEIYGYANVSQNTICLTTNGNNPQCASNGLDCASGDAINGFSATYQVNSNKSLKVVRCRPGYNPSGIKGGDYRINNEKPRAVTNLRLTSSTQNKLNLAWDDPGLFAKYDTITETATFTRPHYVDRGKTCGFWPLQTSGKWCHKNYDFDWRLGQCSGVGAVIDEVMSWFGHSGTCDTRVIREYQQFAGTYEKADEYSVYLDADGDTYVTDDGLRKSSSSRSVNFNNLSAARAYGVQVKGIKSSKTSEETWAVFNTKAKGTRSAPAIQVAQSSSVAAVTMEASGSTICYSTGVAPTCSDSGGCGDGSIRYTGTLSFTNSVTVQSIACKSGYDPSAVATQAVTVEQMIQESSQIALANLQVMSNDPSLLAMAEYAATAGGAGDITGGEAGSASASTGIDSGSGIGDMLEAEALVMAADASFVDPDAIVGEEALDYNGLRADLIYTPLSEDGYSSQQELAASEESGMQTWFFPFDLVPSGEAEVQSMLNAAGVSVDQAEAGDKGELHIKDSSLKIQGQSTIPGEQAGTLNVQFKATTAGDVMRLMTLDGSDFLRISLKEDGKALQLNSQSGLLATATLAKSAIGNGWQHLVFTYDLENSNYARLYLNGSLISGSIPAVVPGVLISEIGGFTGSFRKTMWFTKGLEDSCADGKFCLARLDSGREFRENLLQNGGFESAENWTGINISTETSSKVGEQAAKVENELSQQVQTVQGRFYRLSYSIKGGGKLIVKNGNNQIGKHTAPADWKYKETIFEGNGGQQTISFLLDDNSNEPVFLDVVSLHDMGNLSPYQASLQCSARAWSINIPEGSQWFKEQPGQILGGEPLSEQERAQVTEDRTAAYTLMKELQKEILTNRFAPYNIERLKQIETLELEILDYNARLQAGSDVHGLFTYWNDQTLEIKIENNCASGFFDLALTARNHGKLPAWYKQFSFEVVQPNSQRTWFHVPAHEDAYFRGIQRVYVPAGNSTIKVTWINDAAEGDEFDADLNIGGISLNPARNKGATEYSLTRNATDYCAEEGRFFLHGRNLSSFHGNETVSYCFPGLPAGRYKVSVLARNFNYQQGFLLPAGYTDFQLDAKADLPNAQPVNILVPASDKEYKRGLSTGYLDHAGGDLKLDLRWKNDKYRPNQKGDANILMRNIRLHPLDD